MSVNNSFPDVTFTSLLGLRQEIDATYKGFNLLPNDGCSPATLMAIEYMDVIFNVLYHQVCNPAIIDKELAKNFKKFISKAIAVYRSGYLEANTSLFAVNMIIELGKRELFVTYVDEYLSEAMKITNDA